MDGCADGMVREHAAAEESARRGRVDVEVRRKDKLEDLWVVSEINPWPWVSMGIRINA